MKLKRAFDSLHKKTIGMNEKEFEDYIYNLLAKTIYLQSRGTQIFEAFAIAINSNVKTDEKISETSTTLSKAKLSTNKIDKLLIKYGKELELLIDSGYGAKRLHKYLKEKHRVFISLSSVKNLIKRIKQQKEEA
jgi:hypothetical protein